ncbi:allene oxide synthase-lipoxygenase protein-like isoform X2 [Ornithodoros turicata]
MGNAISTRLNAVYILKVRTGDRQKAGTDANVYARLLDANGNATRDIHLDNFFQNDHERGKEGRYYIDPEPPIGTPTVFEVWRDRSGISDDWFLEVASVVHRETGETVMVFPVNRWISAEKTHVFQMYDCLLPQNDAFGNQRSDELARRRRMMEYTQNLDGAPVQVRCLPEEEKVAGDTKEVQTLKTKIETKLIRATSTPWTSLADLSNIYKMGLPEPASTCRWKEDSWFGAQRLQGLNPIALRLCLLIPPEFQADEMQLLPFLEGNTMEETIQQKKLFYVDLKLLRNLPCKDDRMIVAPIALFYLNHLGELLPVAIQLFPDKSCDNPVFLPSDPQDTWMLAKMFFNHADAMVHRAWLSLGRTHLLMESVWVCMQRNLSQSHPVYRLLAPHLMHVAQTNASILETYFAPGGWMDTCTTTGVRGLTHILKRAFEEFRIGDDLNLPKSFEASGVTSDVIEAYPFRDDITLIYNAVRSYVDKVISFYYVEEGSIGKDNELREWHKELHKEQSQGGCGIQGIPGNTESGFTAVDQLIELVTGLIVNCTAFHSAVNLSQYDEAGFLPNYPTLMRGNIPRDKVSRTEKDLVDQLPNKDTTLQVITALRRLSARPSHELGNHAVQHLWHHNDVKAHDALKEDLAKSSDTIKQRNRTRKYSYVWLDPDVIPNSVSV